MTVTAPETAARMSLIAMINTEFAPEVFHAQDDFIHDSLGDKRTSIGVSPVRTRPYPRDEQVITIEILVQFYSKYDLKIDPTQRVSPVKIETYAERFRRAIRVSDPKRNDVWFFKVLDLSYPNDPTGNKTRFEAVVAAVGQNSALIESTG